MPVDVVLVLGFSTGVICFAYWRGSWPEKSGAAIISLNIAIDLIARGLLGEWNFSSFSFSRFLIDLIEFGLLLYLALSANRIWPIFSAAAQLVAVAGSLAVLGTGGGMQVAYWAVTQMPLFVQLVALGLGTYFHIRRRQVLGLYRDWRTMAPPDRC